MWSAWVKNSLLASLLFLNCACNLRPSPKKNTARVYLASSLLPLKNYIEKLAPKNLALDLQFLSSSMIAQQVSQGAPWDALILADQEWLNYLEKKLEQKFQPKTFATNTLVLASLKPETKNINIILNNLKSKLALADPEYVPLGRYSKQALEYLKLYKNLDSKIIFGSSAYNTRVLLERGAASYAVLFLSDTSKTGPIYLVSNFDRDTYDEINYIFISNKNSKIICELELLLFSPELRTELIKYNFGLPHEY